MKLDEIRRKFLDYFRRQGHEIVASAPLIPEKDPTLLFTNAGMNQFKDLFLGLEKRPYVRASTAQKCFRASGKHNDLENVGHTARHHTFFEMLGNFSFGDYFKPDAIHFAWDFMTQELALPKDRLWITVYKDDDDALELWKKVAAVPENRILRLGEKDNFWSMGETGPCGPCSEIHIDQGPGIGCGLPSCGIECECDRYLELWNLVFMQYNRDASGAMTPLPRPSIDTGMGLERIAAVMQGKFSNYDSDLFETLIKSIADLTHTTYPARADSDVSLRVIADHARAMTFLISDGVLPDNEGRGYVLRRVMRRAARHAKMLGQDRPVLFQAADAVVDLMGGAYPDLLDRRSFVAQVIQNEEERFLETLDSGLKILQDAIAKLGGRGTISGEVAFKLYDTYGFPLDLTQTIAQDEGMAVDVAGFEAAMLRQREQSQKHWKGSGEEAVEAVYKQVLSERGPVEFLGYETIENVGQVTALILDGNTTGRVSKPGQAFQLVTGRTPFYGESGGQVGDTGTVTGTGLEIEVLDAKRPMDDLIVHHCRLLKGQVAVGDEVSLQVNPDRRADTASNHSATHLLQAALRKIVGDHVHQKGSLVTPDRFRFDLTHFSALTPDQVRAIETQVNEWVRGNHQVTVSKLARQDAVKMGAMALFGEKYGEVVRMVEIGGFSRELCGGTHTGRTGDVGLFKIVSEAGVAAGVRRIEGVTGRAALVAVQESEDRLNEAAACLKTNPLELKDRIKKLQDEIKDLKKEIKTERDRKLSGSGSDLYDQVKEINGVKVLVAEVEVADAKELRPLGDQIKDKLKSCVAVIAARANDKAHLLAVVTPDLTARVNAGDIVKEIAPIVGGKGGGRPDFAQAGGPEADKIGEALQQAFVFLSTKL